MPTIPSTRGLNATSVDILNAIRNSATANYRDYVPVATQSTDSIRAIGAVIMNFPALQNEFLTALVNRIGRSQSLSSMTPLSLKAESLPVRFLTFVPLSTF